jgi:hypothetical protein
MSKQHQNNGHIIIPIILIHICWDQRMQKFFQCWFPILTMCNNQIQTINKFLWISLIFLPYPITCHYYILINLMITFKLSYLRYRYHHLLVIGFVLVHFEIEIAESSRDIDTPIYATFVYLTTSFCYTLTLTVEIRLVVLGKVYCDTVAT